MCSNVNRVAAFKQNRDWPPHTVAGWASGGEPQAGRGHDMLADGTCAAERLARKPYLQACWIERATAERCCDFGRSRWSQSSCLGHWAWAGLLNRRTGRDCLRRKLGLLRDDRRGRLEAKVKYKAHFCESSASWKQVIDGAWFHTLALNYLLHRPFKGLNFERG